MTPLRFHNGERELFGLYLEPRPGTARGHAVLLCNPFGQEAIRAHRLYRVLGERLAAAGFHVLRFDYYGSGDSAADDHAWDYQGSVGDAQTALGELLRRSRASNWSAMGLRLGATVALEAARRAGRPAEFLFMIEPVLDGAGYLNGLAASNIDALNRGYGVRWALDARLRSALLPDPRTEALGFVLTPRARTQIESITPACLAQIPATRLSLLVPEPEATRHELAGSGVSLPVCVDVANSETRIDWATDSAAAAAIVPMQWIRHLLDRLTATAHA